MKEISQVLSKLLKDIKPYLDRKDINEIIINQPGLVMLDLGGEEWEYKKDKNITKAFLDDFPKQLATYSNQQFDEKHIYLASAIPGTNNRVGIVHNSLVRSSNNEFNIRVQKEENFTIQDFIKDDINNLNTTKSKLQIFNENDSIEDKIIAIMKNKCNILISGGTSSGKTSLFNVLLGYIPLNHRLVTIEDSPELNPQHRNKTQLLVSKNGSSMSGASYEDMINISMRLRPTNLLLGELDTRNTQAFLRLANTGHEGMAATIHSNTSFDSIQALITNLTYTGSSLPLEGMYNFINSAIDYVIQVNDHRIVEIKSMYEILNQLRGGN